MGVVGEASAAVCCRRLTLMGLITCPDCNARVSEAARACVCCGRPLTPEVVVAGRVRRQQSRRRLVYASGAVSVISLGLFLVLLRGKIVDGHCRIYVFAAKSSLEDEIWVTYHCKLTGDAAKEKNPFADRDAIVLMDDPKGSTWKRCSWSKSADELKAETERHLQDAKACVASHRFWPFWIPRPVGYSPCHVCAWNGRFALL